MALLRACSLIMEAVRRGTKGVVPPAGSRSSALQSQASCVCLYLDAPFVRAIAYIERDGCQLVSRNGNRFKSFGPLCEAIRQQIAGEAILDGEIVCLDGDDSVSLPPTPRPVIDS
jgi:hypothetical protein